MLINKSNHSINFNGAFRIKPNEIKAKNEIPKLLTQGRQIFNNIIEKEDKFIVVRDKYDKKIAQYLLENNITNIEYYPTINTKSGLDDQKPEDLIKLINNKAHEVITNLNEIFETISKRKKEIIPPKSKKILEIISNTLRLNIENPQITSTPQITKIRDKEKKRTIEIIMANKGHCYVYVIPDSLYDNCTRCILDGKGNIIKVFETPDEIIQFSKKFNKLKKEQVNILE